MRLAMSILVSKISLVYRYLILFHLVVVHGSLARTRLLITRVGPCLEEAPSVVNVKEFSIFTKSYEVSISGVINVTEDVAGGWSVKGTMQKCQDIRNTDTCDHFSSLTVVEDGCSSDAHDEEPYAKFFQQAVPPIECPVRAGVYKITDLPLFPEGNVPTAHESKISTSEFGYLFILEGYTVMRQRLLCVEAYLHLLYLRQHNWLGIKTQNQTTYTPTPTPTGDIEKDYNDYE